MPMRMRGEEEEEELRKERGRKGGIYAFSRTENRRERV